MKLYNAIRLWWKFEGRYYHKDFQNGVKNLIRWFPIIWRDRDWDTSYIWNLYIQKLKFQSKYISTENRHTTAKRDAEVMITCVRLMERIENSYYASEFMDYHKSLYNWIDCDHPGSKELDIVELSENYKDYFAKYPLLYKTLLKQYPDVDKKGIAIRMSRENHKRAKRLLFSIMEQSIEKWWD